MDSKCCSACANTRSLSLFLKDTSANPGTKIFATCIPCRERGRKWRARLSSDPVPPQRRPSQPTFYPRESPIPPRPITPPLHPPPPPHPGFLPPEEWRYVQSFYAAISQIKIEACVRCQERWFAMNLKDNICHSCFLRDKGKKSPFLMSADNDMDPGELPPHLPELSQVEEMVIARSHVQMILYRYRGHQYHYSGHCVSFMQNTVKTVDVLPNLPAELDIVVLRPSDRALREEPRYQHQFQTGFRVRKGHIITWLRFLKANHPDYRYITISRDRIDALPLDEDVFSSFHAIIDSTSGDEAPSAPIQPVTNELPPVNSQSVVPNLNITTTEVDLIRQEISGHQPIPQSIPAPSIRQTPIDEASGRERIFAMAFPTLYPTGRADFNAPRQRQVSVLLILYPLCCINHPI
jgi:hypothetical protein